MMLGNKRNNKRPLEPNAYSVPINFSLWLLFVSILLLGLPLNGSIPQPPQFLLEDRITQENGSAVNAVIWGALYLLSWVLIFSRKSGIRSVRRIPILFSLCAMLYFVSAAWSPPGGENLLNIMQIVGSVSLAVLCGTLFRDNEVAFFKLAQLATGINLSLNIVAVVAFPNETVGFDGRWSALIGNPNFLGAIAVFCGISTLALVHLRAISRARMAVFLTIAIVCLIGTNSVTSIITFSSAYVVFLVMRSYQKKGYLRYLAILTSISFTIGGMIFIATQLESIFQTLGRDGGASGRTSIWFTAGNLIYKRPIFGHGMGANTLNTGALPWATNFHNGLLSIGVAIGFIGIVLFMSFIIVQLVRIFRDVERPGSRVMVIVIVPFIVYNFAETAIFLARSPTWVMLIYSVMIFANRPKSGERLGRP